jgi:hypothetical protein
MGTLPETIGTDRQKDYIKRQIAQPAFEHFLCP